MQRIAVPMIGGMISSTILTLVVIPAVYAWIKGFGLPRESSASIPVEGGAEVQTRINVFERSQAAE
jgi:Cu(I)/Ag(I) efflux system membrane protein CusA/SilA